MILFHFLEIDGHEIGKKKTKKKRRENEKVRENRGGKKRV